MVISAIIQILVTLTAIQLECDSRLHGRMLVANLFQIMDGVNGSEDRMLRSTVCHWIVNICG